MKDMIHSSIYKLSQWLAENGYRAYEPFDGLSSYLRPLTFYRKFPQQCLQQFVMRCPINVRPYLGVCKKHSTKAMGFFARGYLRLYLADGDERYLQRCNECLEWLIDNHSSGYSGYCWGNAFDYQSRGFYLEEGVPTVVWVSLIGHAFLDTYDVLKIDKYKEVALSCGEFILNDLPRTKEMKGECISYVPFMNMSIHNSNMLAAGFLARLYSLNKDDTYFVVARKAMSYSVSCQLENGGWYYGEEKKFQWIDSWHTAYNLDSIKYYTDYTGDESFWDAFHNGVKFYLGNFFLKSGRPKFYWNRLAAADIQCTGQALDSLISYGNDYPVTVEIAQKVAVWTIQNMQAEDGHFYFRKYKHMIDKTPMLHWGQATMLSGLTSLYLHMKSI